MEGRCAQLEARDRLPDRWKRETDECSSCRGWVTVAVQRSPVGCRPSSEVVTGRTCSRCGYPLAGRRLPARVASRPADTPVVPSRPVPRWTELQPIPRRRTSPSASTSLPCRSFSVQHWSTCCCHGSDLPASPTPAALCRAADWSDWPRSRESRAWRSSSPRTTAPIWAVLPRRWTRRRGRPSSSCFCWSWARSWAPCSCLPPAAVRRRPARPCRVGGGADPGGRVRQRRVGGRSALGPARHLGSCRNLARLGYLDHAATSGAIAPTPSTGSSRSDSGRDAEARLAGSYGRRCARSPLWSCPRPEEQG